MKIIFCIYFFIFGFLIQSASGFELKGKIELTKGWQPVVFLASLNSPEDIFVASPDFIISKTLIQPDGRFEFKNVNIPFDQRFYRLYLVNNEFSTVEFNTSENRNFIHLVLDNRTNISIEASLAGNKFELLSIIGSDNNRKVVAFDNEFQNWTGKFSSDQSKAQKDFLIKGLDKFIKEYVNSCSNSIVGLYALYHIDEKETDFLRNNEFYFNFQRKIKEQYPDALYTQKFDELLDDLVGFRQLVCEIPSVAQKWKDYLLLIESVILLALIIIVFLLISKLKQTAKTNSSDNRIRINSFSNLTGKEREILKLLSEGKSNKEIAALLFIELSTVKTHINSIYKQLKIAGRKEAINYYTSFHK